MNANLCVSAGLIPIGYFSALTCQILTISCPVIFISTIFLFRSSTNESKTISFFLNIAGLMCP